MTYLIATKHAGRLFVRDVSRFIRYNNHIELIWTYAGERWSCFTAYTNFVEWVQDGFSVTCYDCWDKYAVSAHGARHCTHVVYPNSERTQAKGLANVLRMDLLC